MQRKRKKNQEAFFSLQQSALNITHQGLENIPPVNSFSTLGFLQSRFFFLKGLQRSQFSSCTLLCSLCHCINPAARCPCSASLQAGRVHRANMYKGGGEAQHHSDVPPNAVACPALLHRHHFFGECRDHNLSGKWAGFLTWYSFWLLYSSFVNSDVRNAGVSHTSVQLRQPRVQPPRRLSAPAEQTCREETAAIASVRYCGFRLSVS